MTWNGAGSDNLWSTSSNWAGGSSPTNNGLQNVTLAGSVRPSPVVDIPWSILGLNMAAGSAAFSLTGSDLTIGTGGISVLSSANQTISNNLILAGNQSFTASGGNLTISGNLSLGAAALSLNSSASRSVVLSGTVSGSGSLLKAGTGSLTLSATNTFSGGFRLNAGTVTAGGNASFGTGLLTLAGGTLTTSAPRTFSNNTTASGTVAFSGANMTFSTGTFTLVANTTLNTAVTLALANGVTESGGSRTLTKSGAGTLIISQALGVTGNITLSAGVMALSPGVALPASNLTFGGGTLATSGTFHRALGTGAGQFRFTGSGGFAAYGGNLTISGVTGIPVWGSTSGFLTSGASLLFGSTIATHVVTWTDSFSLGSANRTISVADNTGSTADGAVISGTISGSGGLMKTGAGRLDVTASNTFSGPVHVQQGELAIPLIADAGISSPLGAGTGSNATILLGSGTSTAVLRYLGPAASSNRSIQLAGSTGGASLIADGSGSLVLTGGVSASVAGTKTLTLSGAGTAENRIAGNITNGSGTVAVTKSGTTTWKLQGNNTYSGNTTISAGELRIENGNALGTGQLLLSGGTLGATGTDVVVANNYTVGANTILAGNTTLTLSGNGSITGSRAITVSNSSETFLSGSSLSFTESNVSRTLTINGTGNLTVSATIQQGPGTGPDGLTKSGTGTLTLNAANNLSGNVTMSGGTMVIGHNQALGNGTLVLTAGTIQAGGASRNVANAITLGGNATVGGNQALTVNGTLTQTASRTLTVNNSANTTLQDVVLSNSVTSRTLTVTGSGNTYIQGVISNGGNSTAGALTKSGSGRLVISGTNTYGGATTVSAGTLEIRSDAALGSTSGNTSVANGAALALSNNITTSEAVTIRGSGIGSTGAIVSVSGNNSILTTVTQGAASTITAQAGKLNLSASAGNSIQGAFALTLGGAGNIALTRALNIGAAALTKTGAGTVTLGWLGTNTAGSVAVTSGKLEIRGSLGAGTLSTAAGSVLETSSGTVIASSSTIAGRHVLGPSTAQSTFTAGLTYSSGSQLDWKLVANSDSGAGTNFDQVLVTGGNLTVNGGTTLNLVFNAPGSSVSWSDAFWGSSRTWTLLARSGAGSTAGNFSTINLSPDSSGQSLASSRPGSGFSVQDLGGSLTVVYAVPEPSSLLLLAAGGGLVALVRAHLNRRRSRRDSET